MSMFVYSSLIVSIIQVTQKSKPLPNNKKNRVRYVLKPFNEIRFIRHIKVCIKHYNIIPWY